MTSRAAPAEKSTAGRAGGLVPWIALGVVYLVWGSTYLGIRYTIASMPALTSMGLRYVLAGALLTVLVAVSTRGRGLRMNLRQFGTATLIGLLLPTLGNGLVAVAERQVSSGLAALLVACVPLYVVGLRRLCGDRPRPVTLLGVVVGLAGLALLLLVGSRADSAGTAGAAWWGPWLVVFAALCWSTGTVVSTRLPLPVNPFAASAVEMLSGGVALLLGGLVGGEHFDVGAVTTSSWVAWSYLVVIGSVGAFSAYVIALERLPVSTVATYAFVNPVIAVLLGVLVAGEHFGAAQLGGGLLVLVAVVLVLRAERQPRGPELR